MKIEDFLRRIDELLQQSIEVLSTTRKLEWGSYVDTGKFRGLRAACLSLLKNLFGEYHPYFSEFNEQVKIEHPEDVEQAVGILNAAKMELNGGWFNTTRGLLSAEIFYDFLEMAEHLLTEGYKDPAAVMIGSVLEKHLRNLCLKYNIDTHIEKNGKLIPKKASLINAELAKSNVYNKLDEKNVTAWLDLRNKAAHGKYDEYTKEQVVLFSNAVNEFMARVSI